MRCRRTKFIVSFVPPLLISALLLGKPQLKNVLKASRVVVKLSVKGFEVILHVFSSVWEATRAPSNIQLLRATRPSRDGQLSLDARQASRQRLSAFREAGVRLCTMRHSFGIAHNKAMRPFALAFPANFPELIRAFAIRATMHGVVDFQFLWLGRQTV
jgi:hypothetical protein